jgi:hypothetical protein
MLSGSCTSVRNVFCLARPPYNKLAGGIPPAARTGLDITRNLAVAVAHSTILADPVSAQGGGQPKST